MSRKATGLLRPLIVPVNLTVDEDEMLARDAHDAGKSKTELMRESYFRGRWFDRLIVLRIKQANARNNAGEPIVFRRMPRK